jgi:hypothetical protein
LITRFIGSSQVVTTNNCNTFKIAVIITHKVFISHVNSSSNTNFPWLSPTENCPVALMVFNITPLHGSHGKHRLLLLRMRVYSFCCLALGMARTTLKTSHVIAISPVDWRADCCLAMSCKHSYFYCASLSKKVFIAPLPSYTRYNIKVSGNHEEPQIMRLEYIYIYIHSKIKYAPTSFQFLFHHAVFYSECDAVIRPSHRTVNSLRFDNLTALVLSNRR